jgi:hypothetical protein
MQFAWFLPSLTEADINDKEDADVDRKVTCALRVVGCFWPGSAGALSTVPLLLW